MKSAVFAILACALPAFVAASEHQARHVNHRDLAKKVAAAAAHEEEPKEAFVEAVVDHETGLKKRDQFSNTRFTYYDVGLGACGMVNSRSDFIVALNSPQYGGGYPGPNCFKMIEISYGGKTATAQITDECPGCPYGGLDMSRGLFDFFASEDLGVLYGSWHFVGQGGGDDNPPPAPKPSPKPKPTPTWTPPPAPTTTWTPPAVEVKKTTSTKKTTSSSSSSSTHHTTSSSSSSTSTHTTSSAVPTTSLALNNGDDAGLAQNAGSAAGSGVLEALNQVVLQVAGMVVAGGDDA